MLFSGQKSFILNKVSLTVQPLTICLKWYKKYNMPVSNNQICAGGQFGQDTCDGDSGGPLQDIITINGLQRYVQTGIISYGPKQCGLDQQPSLYTNVKAYMAWILSNTN